MFKFQIFTILAEEVGCHQIFNFYIIIIDFFTFWCICFWLLLLHNLISFNYTKLINFVVHNKLLINGLLALVELGTYQFVFTMSRIISFSLSRCTHSHWLTQNCTSTTILPPTQTSTSTSTHHQAPVTKIIHAPTHKHQDCIHFEINSVKGGGELVLRQIIRLN